MARILLLYASDDATPARRIRLILETANHTVVTFQALVAAGEALTVLQRAKAATVDWTVAVLSSAAWRSPAFAFDLGVVITQERNEGRVLGVATDDAPIPSIFGSRVVLRFKGDDLFGFLAAFNRATRRELTVDPPQSNFAWGQAQELIAKSGPETAAWAENLQALVIAARAKVVLFLGAGVSTAQGAPNWQALVDD